MQQAQEAKRLAEDQVATMEQKMRTLHAKNVELSTQLQVETRSKRSQEETNRVLAVEQENVAAANRGLQDKVRWGGCLFWV